MKRAFTLIELLIVLGITAILFSVLFDVYVTISRISYRVEEQRYVNEELLFISETLQNFSNRNKIDYTQYGTGLFDTTGFTDVLYMSGEDGVFSIYSSGINCINSGVCDLYLKKGNNEIRLNKSKVYLSKALFKVVPFEKVDYNADTYCESYGGQNVYTCRINQGFWFIVNIYSTNYDDQKWSNDVYLNVQQFFNN